MQIFKYIEKVADKLFKLEMKPLKLVDWFAGIYFFLPNLLYAFFRVLFGLVTFNGRKLLLGGFIVSGCISADWPSSP